nr:hypothetical protein [Tanacetum cinerariifolium]
MDGQRQWGGNGVGRCGCGVVAAVVGSKEVAAEEWGRRGERGSAGGGNGVGRCGCGVVAAVVGSKEVAAEEWGRRGERGNACYSGPG